MRGKFGILILLLFDILYISANDKRALLIGISDYPTLPDKELSWDAIHGSNDVEMIKNTLNKQSFIITTLINSQATASRIRSAFQELYEDCRKGDLVYIHFSGHGQAYEDLSGDEDDGWDEAIVPYDALIKYTPGLYAGENHIIDDELEEYFNKIRYKIGKEGFVYVMLDACHMGGASRGEETEEDVYIRGTDKGFSITGKKFIPKIDKRGNMGISPLKDGADICILEACRAYQTNCEIMEKDKYYGPLSYYVNACLQTIVLSPNSDWVENVRSLMQNDKRLIKQNMVVEKSF